MVNAGGGLPGLHALPRRTDMRRFFLPVPALAAIAALAASAAGIALPATARAQAAATSLQAVDSLGRSMGRIGLQSGSGGMALRLLVEGIATWVPLEAADGATELAFRPGGIVLFTDADCSGPAWLSFGARGAGTRASTLVTGGLRPMLYVADGARTTDKLITHQFDGAACTPYVYGIHNHRQPVWRAAAPPLDVGGMFTPPFTIR
jgi:hypothetical protein